MCKDLHVHERVVTNRQSGTCMHRRWIQALFCLPPGPPDDFLQLDGSAELPAGSRRSSLLLPGATDEDIDDEWHEWRATSPSAEPTGLPAECVQRVEARFQDLEAAAALSSEAAQATALYNVTVCFVTKACHCTTACVRFSQF